MAFFNQMGGGMGGGGSPSAFTAPGMDPMTLALLLRMQNAGGMGGPGMVGGPQLPPPPTSPGGGPGLPMMPGAGMPGGAAGAPGQTGGGGLLQMLAGMDPAKLKQMLGMFGIGGGGMMSGAGPGAAPGAGTGGLY